MKHVLLIYFLIGVSNVMTQRSLDIDSLRLNDIRIIASHNSYKKLPHPKVLKFLSKFQDKLGNQNNPAYIDYGHLPFGEQFSDYGVRGVELDVNYDPKGGHYKRRRVNLFIFGQKQRVKSASMKHPGFKLLHISDVDFETNYYTLIDGLKDIKKWSDSNPKHIPIFINIEAKGSHPADQSKKLHFLGFKKCIPFDSVAYSLLEDEIASVFDREDVYTPGDFKNSFETIHAKVNAQGWPYLKESLGKVIFILEGNNQKIYRSFKCPLMFYYGEEGDLNTAFLLRNNPEGNEDNIRRASDRFMIRTRSDAGTKESRNNDFSRWKSAFNSNAQIISTDYYKADLRWSDYKVNFLQVPSVREKN
tara:strand:+ start:1708 stop:2787 length:1080 start_codon:yes stop_codon:yes gene_type:complete